MLEDELQGKIKQKGGLELTKIVSGSCRFKGCDQGRPELEDT